MSLLKRFLRGLTSYLFRLFILLLALVSGLVLTFHSPQKIEKALASSGIYNTFIDNAIAQTKQTSSINNSSNNLPIDDPAIQAAAKKAFNPQLLQNSGDSIINGTYDWLGGKTLQPNFTIDLTNAKQSFAQDVGTFATQKITSLPVCTLSQLRQLSSDIYWYNLPCRPSNLNIATERAQVVSDASSSKDFLQNPVITYQNLPKDSRGQTVFDKFSKAPKYFKLFKRSPWVIGLLAVICGGLTIWLYQPKRPGWRSIAYSLAGTAIILLISVLIVRWGLHKTTNLHGFISSGVNSSFQQTIIKFIYSIYSSIQQVIIWFAVSYAVIGLVIWLIQHFTKPKVPTAATAKKADIDHKLANQKTTNMDLRMVYDSV